MPAEPQTERIAQSLIDKLGSIDSGDDYWYTVDEAVRVNEWERRWFSPERGGVLHLLRPGMEREVEMTSGEISAQTEFFLLIAMRDPRASDNPYNGDETIQWTVRNRLVRDAKLAIRTLFFSDYIRGIEVGDNIEITSIDHGNYMLGWVIAELNILVTYTYRWPNP